MSTIASNSFHASEGGSGMSTPMIDRLRAQINPS
jgi:hypothetical protein